ncbi:DUF938 domain-containing protein [Planktotalea sp.]|uniref:DUF938 domain-containing protein n=1 Tax=Planktotalea sp. TaxID=2029877 RepID=UPI003F6B86D1
MTLPATASITERMDDGRLVAPSAEKNVNALCQVLRDFAPKEGRAIELASGTGQHCVAFAKVCPNLIWVPTDIDDARLASIAIYVSEAQLDNLTLPVKLDASAAGWSASTGPLNLIVLVNLLHLITADAARTLIQEVAQALAPGGMFLLYGPFKCDGALTSVGDARFHESLLTADPKIGYKDDTDILTWVNQNGLAVNEILEMPANNLSFLIRKPE